MNLTIRRPLLVAAALALAACSDSITHPTAEGTAPVLSQAPTWTIFTSQTPTETLDATPGWEVATRFSSSKAGKVIGFRFWRANGETGTNTARLWQDNGTQLASASFSSGGTGRQTVYLNNPVSIAAGTSFRVSVNTNSAQVKTFGYLQNNPIVNGPLTADYSYYGQPTGSMPTNGSFSTFFVDVIFEENVPLPNLYVPGVYLGGQNLWGQEIVTIHVCNNGSAAAAQSMLRLKHWTAPPSGGAWTLKSNNLYVTASMAAGGCVGLQPLGASTIGWNLYEVFADDTKVVLESNENDNYNYATWYKQW